MIRTAILYTLLLPTAALAHGTGAAHTHAESVTSAVVIGVLLLLSICPPVLARIRNR